MKAFKPLSTLRRRIRIRRDYAMLHDLPDALLQDMGINRHRIPKQSLFRSGRN